jgi:tripartite-type tricarboxylate transporter receptor subunit TctC
MFNRLLRHGSVIALALAALTLNAAAQSFPDRPVRIVVPFPAGGSNDVIARILAKQMGDFLKQQFIIENRAGAGGNTGADFVAKSKPDGYTLLVSAPGPLAVNPTLYSKLPFDPAKDFAPIALVASVPIILMVHPSIAANSVQELIAFAKKNPGKLNFASSGIGSTNHLAGELFKSMAGLDIVHVPYRGAAPAMNDLIAGHVPIMFDNMPAALPQINGNKVKPLAVAGATRVEALGKLPTVAETGLKGFEATAWFGLVAPAATPTPVLAKLTEAAEKALSDPSLKAQFAKLGATPGTVFGAKFGDFLKAENTKWADVIRRAGIKPR